MWKKRSELGNLTFIFTLYQCFARRHGRVNAAFISNGQWRSDVSENYWNGFGNLNAVEAEWLYLWGNAEATEIMDWKWNDTWYTQILRSSSDITTTTHGFWCPLAEHSRQVRYISESMRVVSDATSLLRCTIFSGHILCLFPRFKTGSS